jgi:hypothetical protein
MHAFIIWSVCASNAFSWIVCRDERIVSRAIEVNEQLQKVLERHDDLLSSKVTTTVNQFDHEEAEEQEEPEQLFRR